MRLFGLNRRHSRTVLLALGQLILIAYIFQVAAFDHWQGHGGLDVTGVVGTSEHAALHVDHCHGTPASCADAAAGFAHLSQDDAFASPLQAPSLDFGIDLSVPIPLQAVTLSPTEPPQLG